MKISVVIPAYNEEKLLKKCLESLKNQIEKPFEIIVVDNNSTDKTTQVAKKMGAIVVKEAKQGISSARNAGFNTANGDVIARLDADTVAPKDWILKIRQNLEKGVEAVSGPASYLNLPEKIQFSHLPSLYYFRFLKLFFKKNMLFGPNMAIKKSLWEKVKNEVCVDDKKIHEDFDLAIHLWRYAEIKFDRKLQVITSPRRWKNPYFYFEYTYRLLKMLKSHKLLHSPFRI